MYIITLSNGTVEEIETLKKGAQELATACFDRGQLNPFVTEVFDYAYNEPLSESAVQEFNKDLSRFMEGECEPKEGRYEKYSVPGRPYEAY